MAQGRSTPEKKLLELIESPIDHTLQKIKKKFEYFHSEYFSLEFNTR